MACFLNSPFSAVEYRTSPQQKTKSRQAAYEKKYGSPKVELLRQKCRERVKEARKDKFSSGRKLFEDKTIIQKIVLEELTELDLQLEDIVVKEILNEANVWFAEALEEEEETYLTTSANTSNSVFCPICQKYCLETSPTNASTLQCQCGIRFNFYGSPDDFHQNMIKTVTNHEEKCDANLGFFIEPINYSGLVLNAFCDQCEFFYSIQ